MILLFFKKAMAVVLVTAVAVVPVPFSRSNRAEAQWQAVPAITAAELATATVGAALFVGTLVAGAIAARKPLATVWNDAIDASAAFNEKWTREIDRIFNEQFDTLSRRVARANDMTAEGFSVARASSTFVASKPPALDSFENSPAWIGLEILTAEFVAKHRLGELSAEEQIKIVKGSPQLTHELNELLNAYGVLVLQVSGLGQEVLARMKGSVGTILKCLANPQMWKILAAGAGNFVLPLAIVVSAVQFEVHSGAAKEEKKEKAPPELFVDGISLFFLWSMFAAKALLLPKKMEWHRLYPPGMFEEGPELFRLIPACSEAIDLTQHERWAIRAGLVKLGLFTAVGGGLNALSAYLFSRARADITRTSVPPPRP
ncbi:MAG: hypothetical protein V1495_03310 [Pseudomonadota bacterium]